MPNASVRKHGFESEREIACVAVGENGGAAGIRRQHAADRCAAFRRQTERKQPPRALGRMLRLGQRHACFDDHRAARRVDVTNLFHAGQRQHDLIAGRRWNLAADEPRIPTLRDDADSFVVRESQNARDFVRRLGAQHNRRLARIAVTPFAEIRRLVVRAGQRVRRADDVGEA